jgi:hypothetical protein
MPENTSRQGQGEILICPFSENLIFIFWKVCQIKKRLYLCSPFDFKKSKKGIKKFFEKIEASLAEANSSKINNSNYGEIASPRD